MNEKSKGGGQGRINWYPGHMAKSLRKIEEELKVCDAVIELCDARAPMATRDPVLKELCGSRKRLLVLNKQDLANERETARWIAYLRAQGENVTRFNSVSGRAQELVRAIEDMTREKTEKALARGIRRTVRVMVLGIPNAGKSTFINRLNGRPVAAAQDRPGVTRSVRWIRLGPYLELLDTPGMLPPRLNDQEAARLLAYLGSVKDGILDTEELTDSLLGVLRGIDPEGTEARYRLSKGGDTLLEAACRGRGWLLPGGRLDTERGSALVLDEFRAGRAGRITLERCPAVPAGEGGEGGAGR